MFDIGWSELLVLGVISLVVLGPKDFPLMMRKIGKYLSAARRMADDFRRQVNDVGSKIEQETLGDLQKETSEVKANLEASINQVLGGSYSLDSSGSNTESSNSNVKPSKTDDAETVKEPHEKIAVEVNDKKTGESDLATNNKENLSS